MITFNFNRPRDWEMDPSKWVADPKSYRETADLGPNGYLELAPDGNAVSVHFVSKHSGMRLIVGDYVSHSHAKWDAAQAFPAIRKPRAEQ